MKKIWGTISHVGVDTSISSDDYRSITLINKIAFIGILVMLSNIPLAFGLNAPEVIPFLLLPALLSAVVFYFNYKKHFLLSKSYFAIMTVVYALIMSTVTGKAGNSQLVFIITAMLPLVFFKSSRIAFPFFILSIIGYVTANYIQNNYPPMIVFPESKVYMLTYTFIPTIIMLAFLITYYFKNINIWYEQQLIDKNEEIAQQNEEITSSIRYAKRIQEAILPPRESLQNLLPGSFVLYLPKDIVSGDFYWVKEANDKIFFAAVDCTGHGVPGAFVSILGHNGLNRCVTEFGISQPAAILDKLNELVDEDLSKKGSDVKDGMDIALCCWDKQAMTLEYAGANNPLYLVRDGELREVKANKQPIGKFENRLPFTNHLLQLQQGDTIYIFSDGFADQFGGPKGKKFKYGAFKKLLTGLSSQESNVQAEELRMEFDQWKGSYEQVDDVCVIGVKA